MKDLFLLLALAGFASGLQAPLHYKYNYFGSVFNGVPENSNTAAGWAMKAEVEVIVEKDDGVAIFKLNDVTMTEYNDDLGCDMREDIPEDLFHPFEDEAVAMAVEAPFRVHLFHYEDYVIESPVDKFEWLTNMRKGIASIFKNEVLNGNFKEQTEGTVSAALHEGKLINVFSVQEETLFGKCKVDYTVYPVPKYLAGTRNRKFKEAIKDDIQGGEESSPLVKRPSSKTSKTSKKSPRKTSKTSKSRPAKYRASGPSLKEDLWHVVRSVDFDHCEERVALQTTSVGFTKDMSGNEAGWTRGRSSVAEYYFRGEPGNVRLERAFVEGASTMAPFGMKTSNIQVRVNQTLQLTSVTSGGNVPTIPSDVKISKTWMYEVFTSAQVPQESKVHPWVVYTGKRGMSYLEYFGADAITPEELTGVKDSVIKFVMEAAKKLSDMDQEHPVTYQNPGTDLETAVGQIIHLSKEDITEIFDKFFEKDVQHVDVLAKKLVVDAAAASGTFNAYQAILDYIKQDKIPPLQIMTIFMTVTNNALCPLAIPGMLDYVLSLSLQEKPFLTSTVLINFAQLVNQMCISPKAREIYFPGPMFGDSGCDKDIIKDRFLPYLKDIIYNDATTWEKEVAFKVLQTLGTPYAFSLLAPVIEGTVVCDRRTRVSAITALEGWSYNDFPSLRGPVIDLLTDVYSDIGEHTDLREAALLAVISWKPDTNFWHRLARLSWREPSKNFAAYITFMIESYAGHSDDYYIKQNQAASHAVKFARPVTPSGRYSFIQIRQSTILEKHISVFEAFFSRPSRTSFDVKEFFYFLMTSLGDINVVDLEIYGYADNFFLQVKDLIKKMMNKGEAEGIAARIAQNFYDQIQDTIRAQKIESNGKPKGQLFVRMFDHLHLFLPITPETISTLPIGDTNGVASLLIQLGMGYDLILGKYFKPFTISSTYPTELGLPLLCVVSTSIALTDLSYSTLGVGGQTPSLDSLKKVDLTAEGLSSLSTFSQSSFYTLLPWNRKYLSAGVISTRDITIPLKVELRMDNKMEEQQASSQLDIQSLYKKKFSLLKATNFPMSMIFPAYQSSNFPLNLRILTKSEPKTKVINLPSKYAGLKMDVTWHSEMAFPFTSLNLFKYFSKEQLEGSPWLLYFFASPTAKQWSFNLEIDPEASPTKKISIESTKSFFQKSENLGQISQTSSNDYSQYGQESFDQYDQTPDQIFQEFDVPGEVETLPHVNLGDPMEKRGKILQSLLGDSVHSYFLKFEFSGDETRTYELMFSSGKTKPSDTRKVKKVQLSLMRSPLPNFDDKPASICLDIQKSLPYSKLDTVETFLNSDLKRSIKAELLLDCKGEPVVSVVGSNLLSDAWKEKLRKEIYEACDYDSFSPLHTLFSHAVYDELKYSVTWKKLCEQDRFPLTKAIFNKINKLMVVTSLKDMCTESTSKREMQIEAHRCPKNGNWHIEVEHDSSNLHVEEVEHNNWFQYLFSIGKRPRELPDEIDSVSYMESDTCVVGIDSVRTFDGFVYDYEPSPCWTVAAKDCHSENGKMLLVRSSTGESTMPEAKYIDVKRGLVIEYQRNTIKVNGKVVEPFGLEEVIKDDEGNFLVSVFKRDDFYMLKFAKNFYISAKEKIRIHVMGEMKSSMCGLCGNFDGEPEAELVGPHRCFYEDPKMFAKAWTAGGDTCDLYTLLSLREEAEKFQKKCTTIDSLMATCPAFNHRCSKFGWVVRAIGEDKSCVSGTPIPYCEEGCTSFEAPMAQVQFNCWPNAKAPSVIKEALANESAYITSPIPTEPYYHDDYVYLPIPKACKAY